MTDVAEQTESAEIGSLHKDTLDFTVPKEAPVEAERGTSVQREFEFRQITTEAEAYKVIASKEWNLVELVNRKLKGDARSNAYQALTLKYKPSTVSPDEIKERAIRDLMRIGIPEEMAKAQVEAMLAAKNG
jgi:hypothetical protein